MQLAEHTCVHKKVCSHEAALIVYSLFVFLINFCSGQFCDDRERALFLAKMATVSDISHELILNCTWKE